LSTKTSGWLSSDGVFYGAITINEGKKNEYTYNIGSDEFRGDVGKVVEHIKEVEKLVDNRL